MFKFNFNAENENTSSSKEVSEADEIQWYESKEIKIPPKVLETVKNIPRDQIVIDYDCGFTCNCLSAKEVMNTLKEKSGNDELLDVLKADKEHSDLLPGKYEGGLKTWECTKDLVEYFLNNTKNKKQSCDLKGKQVLDLGCGSGILGIMSLQLGAHVVFQDYNLEVLEAMTMPNIFLNFDDSIRERVKLYSGDWTSFLKLYSKSNDKTNKFDFILTSETIYNPKNYSKILEILKNLLQPSGVAFVAAKNHYFGVGGSLFEFESLFQENHLVGELCWKTSEGVSRGILKVQLQNGVDTTGKK